MIPTSLTHFIGRSQLSAIETCLRGEEKEFFQAKIAEFEKRVAEMPRPYSTNEQGMDAVAHLHYFTRGFDWYITERDSSDEQSQAFGSVNLGYGVELGYISIQEIIENGGELDLHFKPKPLYECVK